MKNEQVEYALSLLSDIAQALTRLADCREREEKAIVAFRRLVTEPTVVVDE